MTPARACVAVLALGAWTACSARPLAPEPVPVDRAHCARCDMIISDERNAAEAVSASDDTRFYDDIGCLAHDRAARDHLRRLYVREREGGRWLAAEEAWFARPAGLETPMGHGIAAYASESAARAADRDGRAVGWLEITREAEGRP